MCIHHTPVHLVLHMPSGAPATILSVAILQVLTRTKSDIFGWPQICSSIAPPRRRSPNRSPCLDEQGPIATRSLRSPIGCTVAAVGTLGGGHTLPSAKANKDGDDDSRYDVCKGDRMAASGAGAVIPEMINSRQVSDKDADRRRAGEAHDDEKRASDRLWEAEDMAEAIRKDAERTAEDTRSRARAQATAMRVRMERDCEINTLLVRRRALDSGARGRVRETEKGGEGTHSDVASDWRARAGGSSRGGRDKDAARPTAYDAAVLHAAVLHASVAKELRAHTSTKEDGGDPIATKIDVVPARGGRRGEGRGGGGGRDSSAHLLKNNTSTDGCRRAGGGGASRASVLFSGNIDPLLESARDQVRAFHHRRNASREVRRFFNFVLFLFF